MTSSQPTEPRQQGAEPRQVIPTSVSSSSSPLPSPLTATCHCGRVTITIPTPPQRINECRCSLCYTYGALWAYYRRGDVTVTTSADPPPGVSQVSYVRTDPAGDGDIGFYHCGHCGSLTHWWGVRDTPRRKRLGPNSKMGFNCRLLPEKAIEGVERRVSYQ